MFFGDKDIAYTSAWRITSCMLTIESHAWSPHSSHFHVSFNISLVTGFSVSWSFTLRDLICLTVACTSSKDPVWRSVSFIFAPEERLQLWKCKNLYHVCMQHACFPLLPKHVFPWSSMPQASPVSHSYRHAGEASIHVYEYPCMWVWVHTWKSFCTCCPRNWWSTLSYVPGFFPVLKRFPNETMHAG